MPQRNSGFDGTPCHDLCTDVALMSHGHLISSGVYHSGHDLSDESPELLAEGDRNQYFWDELYPGNGDENSALSVDEGTSQEGDDDSTDVYLLEQFAHERAIQEAVAREEQMLQAYQDAQNIPFFEYQHHHGISKRAAQVRSEVYEVAGSLGGRMRHMNPRKHQQFYGNLRIH